MTTPDNAGPAKKLIERRAFTRVPVKMDVDIETIDGVEIRGTVLNLSIQGFFVRTKEFAPVGSGCRVQLYPVGRGKGVLHAEGQIVREGIEGFGIAFQNLPFRTFEVIKKIILSLSHDPDMVEEELLSRLGIPPGE